MSAVKGDDSNGDKLTDNKQFTQGLRENSEKERCPCERHRDGTTVKAAQEVQGW